MPPKVTIQLFKYNSLRAARQLRKSLQTAIFPEIFSQKYLTYFLPGMAVKNIRRSQCDRPTGMSSLKLDVDLIDNHFTF